MLKGVMMVEYTQFVLFRLGEEYYGADISNVREVILPQKPRRLPNNPDFIEGVLDYRGEILPLLDLKKRFGLGDSDYNREARIIITELEQGAAAFMVDEVAEIVRASGQDLVQVPESTRIGKEYITGAFRQGERLVILLDMSRVLSVDEQTVLKEMSKS